MTPFITVAICYSLATISSLVYILTKSKNGKRKRNRY